MLTWRLVFFYSLALLVCSSACNKEELAVIPKPPENRDTIHYLALGDSYIIRQFVASNAAAKTITEELGVLFLDITPISREAANDETLIATDGLHPSGKMYRRWVEEVIFPAVKPVLE
ncbi:MAG: hypothetical protein DHS20C18_39840 [Saprospiraceae bacterium]|nr:MAG: hypothetical protein DHS20C18_39840 [Saprospiraceae bacterium]